MKLRKSTLRVVVEVPDEEIDAQVNPLDPPPEVLTRARALRATFDSIRDAPPTPDVELPEQSEKQRQRIEAYALRENC